MPIHKVNIKDHIYQLYDKLQNIMIKIDDNIIITKIYKFILK